MIHHFNLLKLIVTLSVLLATHISQGKELYPVSISPNMPYVEVKHSGTPVRLQRIQDINNRLVDDFTKTSRACPPFCIQPLHIAPDVDTYAELELIDFLLNDVKEEKGLLVDARMPNWYQAETIPGALNIPFVVIKVENPNMDKIMLALGAVMNKKGALDYSTAKNLLLFCNGPWCEQSPQAIKNLIQYGYPAHKLKYYRGGMQLWKSLGLTTVIPSNKLKEGEK
ncbi:MAG: rhodanese-like domain-containing protein [Gammaproteobacteria bacterium]|nr:rhodanese-like domain-containing protein [Gammaproteobacteria bacterium]